MALTKQYRFDVIQLPLDAIDSHYIMQGLVTILTSSPSANSFGHIAKKRLPHGTQAGKNPRLPISGSIVELFAYFSKLLQILFVDLILAGDNAIVIGMVAARFTPEYRRKVILWGVGAAIFLRVAFALLTVQLLAITGLTLLGGLLLLWVCWKLWQDLRATEPTSQAHDTDTQEDASDPPSLPSAVLQIVVADVSMSLDNVLAVAGVADGHSELLVIGLALSIIFMMFFATWIAELLQKHRWIGYVGLLVILYVGFKLVIEGGLEVAAWTG